MPQSSRRKVSVAGAGGAGGQLGEGAWSGQQEPGRWTLRVPEQTAGLSGTWILRGGQQWGAGVTVFEEDSSGRCVGGGSGQGLKVGTWVSRLSSPRERRRGLRRGRRDVSHLLASRSLSFVVC